MKAFDCVNKQEVEVTKEGLIDFMKKDRQIDMKFAEKRTDDLGRRKLDLRGRTEQVHALLFTGGPCAEGLHQPQYLRYGK